MWSLLATIIYQGVTNNPSKSVSKASDNLVKCESFRKKSTLRQTLDLVAFLG